MERPKNSTVQHGMASCAEYGCKREKCREALRRRRRKSNLTPKDEKGAMPIDQARQHCFNLKNAGRPPGDIAALSGISVDQVLRLMRGEPAYVKRATHDALLGVPMPRSEHEVGSQMLVDATGSRRRLQALAVQGFTASFLASESEMVRATILAIRTGEQARIRVATLRIISALHDRFWDEDPLEAGLGPSGVALIKNHAKREEWHPTEAWADIDDPDCQPTLKTPRYVILAENYRELVKEQNYSVQDAAERIGVSKNTLDKAVRYYEKRMSQLGEGS